MSSSSSSSSSSIITFSNFLTLALHCIIIAISFGLSLFGPLPWCGLMPDDVDCVLLIFTFWLLFLHAGNVSVQKFEKLCEGVRKCE